MGISRWKSARSPGPNDRGNAELRWGDAEDRIRGIRGEHLCGSVGGGPKYVDPHLDEGVGWGCGWVVCVWGLGRPDMQKFADRATQGEKSGGSRNQAHGMWKKRRTRRTCLQPGGFGFLIIRGGNRAPSTFEEGYQ